MSLFDKVVAGQLEEVDPVTGAARHANRLLEQFGCEHKLALNKDGEFVDYDENETSFRFTSLSTDEVRAEDPEYGFFLDNIPYQDGKPLVEIGFVALHLSEYEFDDEIMHREQIVFRQETHDDGAALFKGDDMTPVESPGEVITISFGLLKIEELLWRSNINDGSAYVYQYPKSEVAMACGDFLAKKAKE